MLLLIPGKLPSPATPSSQPFRLKCPSERLSPDTCPEQGPSSFLPPYSVHFPHRLCNNVFGVATFLWFEGLPPRRAPTLTLLEAPWRPFLQRPFLPWQTLLFLHLAHISWCSLPHLVIETPFYRKGNWVSRDTVYGRRGQWSNPDLLTLSPDFKAVPTPRLPLWSTVIWFDFLGEE